MADIKIKTGKMIWKNPVTVASGTFGLEFAELFDLSQLGAIATKTITLHPKKGNEPPRLAETEAGLLNSIGLQNPGLENFIKNDLPEYRKIDTNLIVSISADSISQFGEVIQALDRQPGIDGYEINVSCPNVENEGIAFGTNKEVVYNLVSQIRKNTERTIIVKLSPNVTSIEDIAKAAEKGGADVLSLINTVYGMAIDIETRKPKIKNVIAGYSGIGIKPIALQNVYRAAKVVKIPIIGMGGIRNINDALEFIIAGASAIAVGTQNFVNPLASLEIIQGLKKYLDEKKVQYKDLINSVNF
ncbi:MAG: dihydroorotate dehydrogenase [Candidatus Cloacimonetes bacterium]|nr:dihydroorotate dehydrogenase [Candidatus Cloacimonadota bacterium]